MVRSWQLKRAPAATRVSAMCAANRTSTYHTHLSTAHSAAECVTQQHDHCLAHRAIALRLRVGMPAEACLGAVLLQNMDKCNLHARAGNECHALQLIESREPSTKTASGLTLGLAGAALWEEMPEVNCTLLLLTL